MANDSLIRRIDLHGNVDLTNFHADIHDYEGFEKEDFRLWYDAELDRVAPIADNTFHADGFSPILITFNCFAKKTMNDGMSMIVGEKVIDGKRYVLSTLDFRMENPVAKRFMKALLELP